MPFPARFFRPPRFLQDVLPGLVPSADALTLLFASYHRMPLLPGIGSVREDGLMTRFIHDANVADPVVPTRIADTLDLDAPVLAFIYAGERRTDMTLRFIDRLHRTIDGLKVVALTCDHAAHESQAQFENALDRSVLSSIVVGRCGGLRESRLVHDAACAAWSPVRAAQPHFPAETSANLGA